MRGDRNGSGEKVEVWTRLATASFALAAATAWALPLLDLLLRVQINVLGRRLYFASLDECAPPHPAPPLPAPPRQPPPWPPTCLLRSGPSPAAGRCCPGGSRRQQADVLVATKQLDIPSASTSLNAVSRPSLGWSLQRQPVLCTRGLKGLCLSDLSWAGQFCCDSRWHGLLPVTGLHTTSQSEPGIVSQLSDAS